MNCSPFYLAWKLAVTAFAIYLIPYGLCRHPTNLTGQLTFWTWCILTLYFILCLVSCFWKPASKPLTFLQATNFSLANLVTGGVVYRLITSGYINLSLCSSSFHIVNIAIMYIDLLFFPLRSKWWYMIPVLVIGIIYGLFNGIFYASTGVALYREIGWNSWRTPVLIASAFVGVIVAFLWGYFLSRLIPAMKYRVWGDNPTILKDFARLQQANATSRPARGRSSRA